MATRRLDRDIHSRIQSFLAELSGLVRKSALEAVQVALGEDAAPKRRGRPPGSTLRGPGRPRKGIRRELARTGKRIRRSAEDLEKIASRVLAHVRENAGQRLEQIGTALRTDTETLKRPVAQLLEAKKLRTEGRKRGTKYFAGQGRGTARKARTGRQAKARTRRRGKRARKVSRKRTTRRGVKAKATAAVPAATA